MFTKKATYILVFMAFPVLNSCSSLPAYAKGGKAISEKNIHNSKKPEIVQFDAGSCPWDKNYEIKNMKEKKVYGSEYAKKQNSRMKIVR